jgi:glycopeptide antibiotics resistance protein
VRRAASVLLACYLALLLTLTLVLFRAPEVGVEPNLAPFRSIARDWHAGGRNFLVNIVGNVVAFLPLGFLLPLVLRRPTRAWQVALMAAALSATIEALQFASGRRTADVDDVLLNVMGGLAGYVAWRGCGARERPPTR